MLLICLFVMIPSTAFATDVSPTTWTSETKNGIYATVTITDWETHVHDLEIETPVDNMTHTEIFATFQFHGTPQDNCVYTADILHGGKLFMRSILDPSFQIEDSDGEGANKMTRSIHQSVAHKIGAAEIRLGFDYSVVVHGTVGGVQPIDGAAHTIVAEAGDGGEITPSGEIDVPGGATQAFAIAADNGYQIGDVLVDGVSVGAVSGYIFENVRESHTIDVSFIGSSDGNDSAALDIGGIEASDSDGGWTATHTVVVASVAIVAVAGVISTALIVRARRKR